MVDPVLLSAVHDLELVARVTVEGALSGLHRSPFHGYSAEFNHYRHYRPGDDLKYVDWKLFARTDRVYTKQFRETTNARVSLVLDASRSMAYRGASKISKFEYGRAVAAALAYLVIAQGDAAGLVLHDEDLREYVAPRGGQGHLRSLFAALSRQSPRGTTASTRAIRRACDLLSQRGVIVLISDLYDDEDALDAELRRAARIGHDVALFHVLTPEELTLPANHPVLFEDMETGRTVLAGSAASPAYATAIRAFLDRWRERCAAGGIDYGQARIDAPLERLLRAYLLERMRCPQSR